MPKVTDLSASVSDLSSPILRRHVLLLGFGGCMIGSKAKAGYGNQIFHCSHLLSFAVSESRLEQQRSTGCPSCTLLSQTQCFTLEHLPPSEFLKQMYQHLTLLPFSFSYFTPGARYVAGSDKNKFIRKQAPENLEYILVKGPGGQQRNHL